MSSHSKIISYTNNNALLWAMVGAVVMTSIFYMYAVNRTIVMVAQREAIESKIAADRASVTKLESAFISEMGGITRELAQTLGYGEARDTIYVPKKSVSVLVRAETIQ